MNASRGKLICICALVGVLASASVMPVALHAQLPPTLPPHITPQTVRSIQRGIDFLIRNQNRDGSWRSRGSRGQYPVAMTSLAALALLANGNTTTEGPYAPALRRATEYILANARPNGLISHPDEESRSMYGHGFAMLYLGQLYGMTEDAQEQARIRHVLDAGVKLTAQAQSRLGGWLYTPDSQGDEGSVTVTQVQALRSCRNAGISVPKATVDRAMEYLDKSMLPSGGIAYRAGMRGGPRPPITAAAVACWFNAGLYDHPNALRALQFCRQQIGAKTALQAFSGHWYYAHLYMAQVMYLVGEDSWAGYFPTMRDILISKQEEDGSWMGDGIGQTYGTAVALVILQLPYGYLPIMQR